VFQRMEEDVVHKNGNEIEDCLCDVSDACHDGN
jgi:hypothetical protein